MAVNIGENNGAYIYFNMNCWGYVDGVLFFNRSLYNTDTDESLNAICKLTIGDSAIVAAYDDVITDFWYATLPANADRSEFHMKPAGVIIDNVSQDILCTPVKTGLPGLAGPIIGITSKDGEIVYVFDYLNGSVFRSYSLATKSVIASSATVEAAAQPILHNTGGIVSVIGTPGSLSLRKYK